MALINPHINFNGNAEEAFTFYKSVFGGEFAKIIRFKDIAGPEFPVAKKEENVICCWQMMSLKLWDGQMKTKTEVKFQ
jgi:uncharacterized glyoxalase superfamily protein PhnB